MPKPYLSTRPIVLAHRGSGLLYPENTLLAFERAVMAGHRYLETDLRLTRDGVVVVFHDGVVDRVTDGRGRVASMRYTEIASLDAAHRFSADGGQTFPYRAKGLRIPTLEEALARFPATRFNLDLKDRSSRLVEAVCAIIKAQGAEDRVLLASEHGPTIRRCRTIAGPRMATSGAFDEVFRFWTRVRLGLPPQRVAFDALQVPETWRGLRVVDEPFVEAAHRAGAGVHVFTVNDPADMSRLLGFGVDGLVTDRFDLIGPGGTPVAGIH